MRRRVIGGGRKVGVRGGGEAPWALPAAEDVGSSGKGDGDGFSDLVMARDGSGGGLSSYALDGWEGESLLDFILQQYVGPPQPSEAIVSSSDGQAGNGGPAWQSDGISVDLLVAEEDSGAGLGEDGFDEASYLSLIPI